MKSILLLLSLACLTLTDCKKKTEEIKDCEKNNYAVVNITFGSASTRHNIIITYPGATYFRDKIIPLGVTTDTLHLYPGVYPIFFASIDNMGMVTYSDTKTYTATKCNEQSYSFTF